MPSLALLFSFIFSIWFLVRDVKGRPTVSSAVWLPTLLIMSLGSRSPSLWMSLGTPIYGSGGEGNPLDHVFYLSLSIGSCLIANSRGVNWRKLFAWNNAITLFYLYFAISILWAESPDGSFKRWVKDFSFITVIALLLSEKDPLEAMRAVYIRAAAVLLPLSVVFCRYFPMISRRYTVEGGLELSGAAIDKNHLGEGVMVMAFFLCWDLAEARSKKRRWKWDCLVLGLMVVWLMKTSNSKTAFACLLIGMALMLRPAWLASRPLLNRTLLLGALSLPIMVLLTQEFSTTITPVLAMLGRDATFTGRTAIWENITWNTVNPLIGAGFWNFWGGSRGIAITTAMKTIVPSAHNGYLDIYLDGGLIGVALLFYLLFKNGNRIIKSRPLQQHQLFRFSVLIAAIIYNLTESLYARPSVLWFTTLLTVMDLPSKKLGKEGQAQDVRRPTKPLWDDWQPDSATEPDTGWGGRVRRLDATSEVRCSSSSFNPVL